MSQIRRGLVVGKFAPLHRGHQLLLETAAAQVDELHVWVYSNPEPRNMPAAVRAGWIRAIYAQGESVAIGQTLLHLRALTPEADQLPPNSADDQTHREYVRSRLRELDLRIDVVFTSEAYGAGFAEYIGAEHVCVDLNRHRIPVSGTLIRADVYAHAEWLHPVVQAHFQSAAYVQRIALVGAESTGKSTLTAALGLHFGTAWVAEYGRTLYEEQGGVLVYDDLLRIARRHRELEDAALPEARHFLFVDTNALTTLYYSYAYFGQGEPALHQLAAACRDRYQHTFVCAPDFPYEQDGTRAPADWQPLQQRMILMQLHLLDIPYTVLTGSVKERLRQVERVLKAEVLAGL